MNAAFTRFLVGLDLTLLDTELIRYTAMLAKHLQPERIRFVHVERGHELDEEIVREFPQLLLPQDEALREELTLKVQSDFPDHEQFHVMVDVRQGVPLNELLAAASTSSSDLLILGAKQDLPGSGILGSRLLDRARCALLFVPEKARYRFQEIVVGTDFSPFSRAALEAAASLAGTRGDVSIHCVHVYRVPGARGVDSEELEAAIRGNVTRRYNRFIEDTHADLPHVRPVFVRLQSKSLGHTLVQAAERHSADLIVMGSSGHSWPMTRLEGSTPQMILREACHIPLLIVKDSATASKSHPAEVAHTLTST